MPSMAVRVMTPQMPHYSEHLRAYRARPCAVRARFSNFNMAMWQRFRGELIVKSEELIVKSEIKMKAKSKSQLAEMAGVSVDTLREWMKPFRQDLEAMGLRQNARVLPPNIVKFLAEKLCIDVED